MIESIPAAFILNRWKEMVIVFGVPKEHFESVKLFLLAYDDLTVEVKVSTGTIVNVFPQFTEEIPAKFFHIQLRGDLVKSPVVVRQLVESLSKGLEMYMSYPGPKITIFDRDSI